MIGIGTAPLAEVTQQRDELLAALGTQAAKDVIAERTRQQSIEGWTPEHDDQHQAGSLGAAGGFYALNACKAMFYGTTDTSICNISPAGWPWASEWWKPSSARRDIVKAAALILAEIERMDRAAIASVKSSKCETCNGRGEIGGHVGQTPESFDYVTEPCPDCVKGGA